MLRLYWFPATGYSRAVILWQPENNYNNSEFKVQNSDFRLLNFEFWIQKYATN